MDDNFKAQLHAVIPALRGYAMSLTRSAADADDMVQEALLRAWRSRHSYREETYFKAWMFRILVNVVRSAAKQRRPSVDLDSPAAQALGRAPEQEWRAQYAQVLAAMDQLSPTAREALLLVIGGGLSYEDAAQTVGVPIGTMKSRVARARDALAVFADIDVTGRIASLPRGGRTGEASVHGFRQRPAALRHAAPPDAGDDTPASAA